MNAAVSHPSTVIKDFFNKYDSPTTEQVETLAKSVLLPVPEVHMWLSHLGEVQRNRKRGAAQAALTRKSKQQNLSTVQSLYLPLIPCCRAQFLSLMLNTSVVCVESNMRM